MKQILPITLVSLFLFTSWFFFSSHREELFGVEYSGGPANSGLDKTGGPLSGGNSCGQCHFGGSGSTSMTFELIDSNNVVVSSYIPGGTYTVKHQVTSTSIIKGFQSVALLAANTQAGTFTTVLSTQSHISTLAGKQYIEHVGSSGSGLFQFTWIAPPVGSGTVTFYSASNGVNGNGGTTGDTPGSPISNAITEAPWGSFSYGTNDFCENGNDPTPTITGIMGGTFSAGIGITVDASTGTIDISASTPGTYQINYTFTGGVSAQTITIGQTYNTSNTASICAGDSIFLEGAWQNSPGLYQTTLQSVIGCDSVVTTNLSIIPTSSSQNAMAICEGDLAVIGGVFYSAAGTYTHVIPNAAGCDSTITTVLSVNPNYEDTISETICQGDSTLFSGVWYSATGMYTNTGTAVTSCDSLSTLNLTVSPLDLSVSTAATVLTAGQAGATYKWLDCDAGFTAIAGATSQSYTATANGNYAVEVTFQNCTDTSACSAIAGIGLEELNFGAVKLYPNPSNGSLNLSFSQDISAEVELFDLNGKSLMKDRISNATNYFQKVDLSAGTYIIHIENDQASKRLLWIVK